MLPFFYGFAQLLTQPGLSTPVHAEPVIYLLDEDGWIVLQCVGIGVNGPIQGIYLISHGMISRQGWFAVEGAVEIPEYMEDSIKLNPRLKVTEVGEGVAKLFPHPR